MRENIQKLIAEASKSKIGLVEDHSKSAKKILRLTKDSPELPMLQAMIATGLNFNELKEVVERLKGQGHDIDLAAKDSSIVRQLVPKSGQLVHHFARIGGARVVKIGVLGDNQLGNFASRLDVLNTAYEHYAAEGITDVYHTGNMIDGYAPNINFNELLPEAGFAIDSQSEYAAAVYPKKKGITTHFITGECFSGDTEVLTRKGFVRFDELMSGSEPPTGTEVLTLNMQTGSMEWQTPEAHIRRPLEPGERMLHFKNQKIDLFVTEGHEMLSRQRSHGGAPAGPWERTRARDWSVGANRQMLRAAWAHRGESPGKMHGYEAAAWCRFMGWYLSEGSSLRDGRFDIAQMSNGPYYPELGELLRGMGFDFAAGKKGFRIKDPCLSDYLSQFGRSWEKWIPGDIKALSPALINEFLVAFWKGDGNIGNGKHWKRAGHLMSASTASKRMAEDLCELLLKSGRGAHLSFLDRSSGQVFPNGVRSKTRRREYRVGATTKIFPHYRGTPEVVAYDGLVYCVSVPNGTIVAKRNQKIGIHSNCHEGWWYRKVGINVGRAMQGHFDRLDRSDLDYVGHLEADVEIRPKWAPRGPMIRLSHPGGGTAYAISYKTQKQAESLQGGEKPHIQFVGHFHKFDWNYHREIHNIQTGTTCDQTVFMRKHNIPAHVGYLICELLIAEDGILESLKVEWKPFYDRGFYRKWVK